MHRMLVIAILIVASGCGAPLETSETPPSLGPLEGEAREAGFRLSVRAEEGRVRTGDEIHVTATFGHDRDRDVTLSGSGSGVVFFSVTRVEDGLTSGPPAHTDDCVIHVIPAGEPVTVPFAKSGGFSPEDPNADFLALYFSDLALSLPAGTWRIEATSSARVGEGCTGDLLELAASVEVRVTD
jgi:hypothetical protein